MKVYVSDALVIVNNKFESKCFVYDRLDHIEYEINEDCFDILEDIKNNNYTVNEVNKKYDKAFIDELFTLNILKCDKQNNINNVKRLIKHNNVRLFVELTNRCNLNCKHCYGGFACNNKNNLQIDSIKKMIDNAALNGVYQFDITGGEPTLYPNLEEVLSYAYNAGMIVRIFTNLTTYNDDFKQLIIKYGIKDIVTSIDSCIEEIHDDFRGRKGSFNKTVKAINDLKDLDINISLNTMIGKHNQNHIKELIGFINDLKVKSVLDVIVPEGRAKNLNEDIVKSSKIIKKIYHMNDEVIDKKAIAISCGVANRFIYIKSDGNIYLCPSMINDKYKIGHIDTFDTNKIWNKLEKEYSYIKCDKKEEKCKNCTGGCRARAEILHGSITSEDDVYCIINGVK